MLGVQTASAQLGTYNPPQATPGPSFSPYLNMIRNNPAVNLFGIVQPQMTTYGTLQQLQQDMRYGQTGQVGLGMTNQAINNNAIITGHPVMFGNTAQFFPMSGNQLAGMGAGMGMGGMGLGAGIGAASAPAASVAASASALASARASAAWGRRSIARCRREPCRGKWHSVIIIILIVILIVAAATESRLGLGLRLRIGVQIFV